MADASANSDVTAPDDGKDHADFIRWKDDMLERAELLPYLTACQYLEKAKEHGHQLLSDENARADFDGDVARVLFMKSIMANQRFTECSRRFQEFAQLHIHNVSDTFLVYSAYVQLCVHCGHDEIAEASLSDCLTRLSGTTQDVEEVREALAGLHALGDMVREGRLPTF